jgi:YVTN family beta-propeller protein
MSFQRRGLPRIMLAACASLLVIWGCRHQRDVSAIRADDGNYPADVNRIVMLHCMTGTAGGGCHNAIGADNASSLRMDSWNELFSGNSHGAVVVPFDTINSPLLYYTNIDSALGPVAVPTMPLYETPLSRSDYLTLRNWIANGAPDKNGNVPFAENPETRQKIYIANQASDMLSVVDAERHVVMRNIPVGATTAIESPHCVRVSADGQYAYVCFLAGDYVQKIDTKTDKVIGQVQISNGGSQWNVLLLSADGTRMLVSDLVRGWMRLIRTSDMQVIASVGTDSSPLSPFIHPHGMSATPAFDTIYMTAQYGNTVFKFTPDFRYYKAVSINDSANQYNTGTYDPHEIMLTPDGSKYFVTCEASNEIRVMDAHKDKLLAVFNVPTKPQEIALSLKQPLMLFTCMEGASTLAGTRGAVVAINYQTMQMQTIYGNFWQPHGIAIDDVNGTFYVVSTNIGGPFTGHNHTSSSGKIGWYGIYDLNTLQPLNNRQYELLSQPYSADSRMK